MKTYKIEYLMNEELTEDDLHYIFDHSALIYSIIIAQYRHIGSNASEKSIINTITTTDNWYSNTKWTLKEREEFEKKTTKVFRNVYQCGDDEAANRARQFSIMYGFALK